ncbi:MAG: PA-phosphatase [Bacteroidetes bacterium]|nr:MAG: PA-phosphatase [Bacteroidota bacterium]
MKLKSGIFILLVLFGHQCLSQTRDTSTVNLKAVIVPTSLIIYGTWGTYSNWGLNTNLNVKSKIGSNGNTKVEDYFVLSPAVAVYGLNLLGVKGKHNFKDRTILLGSSYAMLTPVVLGVKEWSGVLRPDASEYTSFPSGHSAFAFASAEFLRLEYRDRSPWYGIIGYAVASTTGVLRIHNNKHWFTDVTAGAGLGILATNTAYWIHPWLKKKVFKNSSERKVILIPTVSQQHTGIVFEMQF